MERTKAEENEHKKKVREYAESLEVFIDHPEMLKDDLLKAYVELLRERIEKERSEKQKQLAMVGTG